MKNGVKITNLWKVVMISLCIVLIIYPLYTLIFSEEAILRYPFYNSGYKILIELFIYFCVGLLFHKKGDIKILLFEFILFCYLHQMLFALLIAFAYFVLVYFVGKLFVDTGDNIIDFFAGILILTFIYCLMSAFNIGNIYTIRILDGVIMFFCVYICVRKRFDFWKLVKFERCSLQVYLIYEVIMIFIMAIIGKANISLDYDSVWYGLRGFFCFNNQDSIYDDMGLVGAPYTYSKGFETIFLPLTDINSYSFFYAGNIIITIILLYVLYKIGKIFCDNTEKMLWIPLLASTIPGIMNMAITAKADNYTLLFQVIMIYACLKNLIDNSITIKWNYVIVSLCIYTFILKATAIVFSITILCAYILINYFSKKEKKIGYKKRKNFVIMILTLIDLILIWGRTFIITGIPEKSLLAKLWLKLGMEYKYPFSDNGMMAVGSMNFEVFISRLQRIWKFWLSPNTADMDHVIIAWGTPIMIFMILNTIAILVRKGNLTRIRGNIALVFMAILFLGETLLCMLLVVVLAKPDGNYFSLCYVCIILASSIIIQNIGAKSMVFMYQKLLPLMLVFNMIYLSTVNWAWTSSFTDIKLINFGYYNHSQEFKEEMNSQGMIQIYDILSEDRSNKVFAFCEHPNILRLPCIVQSEWDVSYWENPDLLASNELFVKFMEYERYDYILVDKEYFTIESPYYTYLCNYIFNGNICDIMVENKYILLKVGESNEYINILETFKKQYMIMDYYGYYQDGWIEQNSQIQIYTGENGIVKGRLWYPGLLFDGKVIDILVDGVSIVQLPIQQEFTDFEICVPTSAVVTLEFKCNFQFENNETDSRNLAVVLQNLETY